MKANTNQNVEQLSSTNIHNLQILLPEAFDFMVTFLIIQSDISLKKLSLSQNNQYLINNISAKFMQVVSDEFRKITSSASINPFHLKELNNNLALFVESLPEIVVEIILGITNDLTHCVFRGKNSLKIFDQFSVAINLLYLARQFDNMPKNVNEDTQHEDNLRQEILDCCESIPLTKIENIYKKLDIIHNDIVSKSKYITPSNNFVHHNVMATLQDQIKAIDLNNEKEQKSASVNNNFTTSSIASALNMLSTIISIIDTSSIKLLKDKDLNDAMKILFFSNGLIAQFCNAIAKDLKSPSKNANFIAENFAQKIKDNIVISTQKIFVAEVEEIITPLLSKLILNSIENPIKLNFISNKLVKNYNVIIPQKNLNDTLFFKLNYSLAMNFKTNLYLYNEQEIVDNEISGFIVSVPLLLKEKNTEIEKFKILAFPLTSFCLSGLQILSKLSFKSLPIKTSHQDELVISTCKLLKTIDSEFKNNYESLVIIHQNKRLDQAIEIFFDKLPELGLEILDIIISTCLHWAFKMPSLLKTFDKLFTTINFMYLANKYQKMVEKNFDCQSIKTKLLEAFENLQSGDIKAAQQEFDLISNNIELQAYKGCVIYNFAHYKTLLAQELNQIDKNKVKKINSTKIKADEEVWINKLSSGFSMLAFVIARVDFNHIIFNKDTELNEAIKSLLVDNGFCYELFISLSNDLKLSLTKGGMITNSSFDNLVKALIIDAEKIILPELLEILLPVIEEVIFDISGESHVIKNALIEWLECIGVKIIELIDQDNCILSTLTTIAKKINDVDSSNLIIDDLEVGGNSFEIN